MKNFKKCLIGLICSFGFLLCGCSTLTYVGEDYTPNNIQTIKTNEDFIFNTYKKSLTNANIKIGISKTPIPEVLAIYVQIENLTYETPYIFKVEDLRVYNPEKEMQFISTTNYLNIYQAQEANSIAAGSAVGGNLTNMITNYNATEYNQTSIQHTNQEANSSAFSRMEELGNQISKHSIKYSSSISPRKSQYYYFFIENLEKYPIRVNYKNLNYQFNL